MKLVHVLWSLGYGGIETMLVNIANSQAKLGADVSIIVVDDLYEETLISTVSLNVKMYFLHRKKGSKCLNFIFHLNYILSRLHPDIVHLHDPRFYGLIFCRKYRKRSCVTFHDMPFGFLKGNFFLQNKFLFSRYKIYGNVVYSNDIPRVFSISSSVKNVLLDKYGVDSTVVKNGIVTSSFRTLKKYNYHSPMHIVQVSRLQHEKKGQDLVLKAIAKMNGMIDVDFIGEGDSLEYLNNMSKDLDIQKNVHFLGKKTQSYIAENLCNYDLFIQPSRYEGFGLTVAEAMAADIPVLVSSGDGPAEITCGDKYGWVFKNGDVDDLVSKIYYIMKNYNSAIRKAELGRLYVEENYDVMVTAQKYLNEYKSLVKI